MDIVSTVSMVVFNRNESVQNRILLGRCLRIVYAFLLASNAQEDRRDGGRGEVTRAEEPRTGSNLVVREDE